MKTTKSLVYLSIWLMFLSCQSPDTPSRVENTRNKEAREDSSKYALAVRGRKQIEHSIPPVVETHPVVAGTNEDAADDPAIWYNSRNPEKSVVFGTNKKGGIYAYDLSGNELEFYPFGEINNIDIRQEIPFDGRMIDVIGGSNRSDNSLILYRIDTTGQLRELLSENLSIDTTDLDEVYGFCLYKYKTDSLYAFINGKNGRINSYVLKRVSGKNIFEKRHVWKTGTQPEGMVADDFHDILYVGEEEKGIWRIDLTEKAVLGEIEIIPDSRKINNPRIEYDIEGLTIYDGNNGDGFLLASIQGNFSYALFERKEKNQYLGSFIINGIDEVDDVEETDGLDIYSLPIGNLFPSGLLVVQDGFNYDDSNIKSQNFKYVDLQEIITLWRELRGKNM